MYLGIADYESLGHPGLCLGNQLRKGSIPFGGGSKKAAT